MKINLFGKTLSELQEITTSLQLPKYTTSQIAGWLYKKEISSINGMTNLSKPVRVALQKEYEINLTPPVKQQISVDGTKKYLFATGNGNHIETVYIPGDQRKTLCISCQAGCKRNCRFCLTGKQGFLGDLDAGEILSQVKNLPESGSITNIVYMGMGEPCDNMEPVLNSLEILTSDWGFAMSPRRITVSTIGIVSEIRELIERSNCHIAVSLHSPFEEERKYLVPAEKKHPLKKIIKILKEYDFGRQRRISFEYIMFKKLNDTVGHAEKLSNMLKDLRCRINLIRFHPVGEPSLQCSDENTIFKFRDILNKKGLITTIRASRGKDISAACGMLAAKETEYTTE
jgi:23S rRNA (adenine2503-C2)-methyltransferase